MPELVIAVFLFLFGLCVGSFLNVCIYRIPAGKSIVWPASHCPRCEQAIVWYDNIPLLSFVWLWARCRHCKGRISLQYPVVDLLTGLVMAGYYLAYFDWQVHDGRLAYWPVYVVHMGLMCTLIVTSVIDFERKEIYPAITNWGMGLAILLSFLFPIVQTMPLGWLGGEGFWGSRFDAVLTSVLGLVVGGGVTWLVRILGRLAFKREAMGFGDVLLMGLIGAVVGWKAAILVFFLAPFFGIIYGVVAMIRGKGREVPYGPFLSMAAAVIILAQGVAGEYFGHQFGPLGQ
ncbi:MAG: prepilin peptidase [Phycisphaerae bacterium]|jgi:leader peptidase (prepilin peptidase)/N-methyltransferase|nr:prepilin peptidase [Phycisphaerae bacterium]